MTRVYLAYVLGHVPAMDVEDVVMMTMKMRCGENVLQQDSQLLQETLNHFSLSQSYAALVSPPLSSRPGFHEQDYLCEYLKNKGSYPAPLP